MCAEQLAFGTLTAGEVHGLVSTVGDLPNMHFATVVEDATVVFWPRAALWPHVFSNVALCEKAMTLVCDRTRSRSRFNERRAPFNPLERVGKYLWSVAAESLSVRKSTAPALELKIRQYELSSMRSLSRQCVNRALGSLESQGVIAVGLKQASEPSGWTRSGG